MLRQPKQQKAPLSRRHATHRRTSTNSRRVSASKTIRRSMAAAATAPSGQADYSAVAQQIAQGLNKDLRERIAQEKIRKPSLAQRLVQTQDLYADKDLDTVSSDDVMKYIPMDINNQEQHMKYYLKSENEASGGYWMVRHPTVQILDWMDSFVNQATLPTPAKPNHIHNVNIPNLGLIYGLRGTGKSILVAQAVQYAKKQGWIAVSFGGFDTIHDMDGVIAHSTLPDSDGLYDQTLKARRFLQRMAELYGEQLKTIELSGDHYAQYGAWDRAEDDRFNAPEDGEFRAEAYPWPDASTGIPRPVGAAPGKTLYDLAALGSWRVDLASWAAKDFLREVSAQTKIPVLIAIDDYNALDQPSDFVNPANLRTRLEANRLTFVRAMQDCVSNPPVRGVTLLATSSKFTQYRVGNHLERPQLKIRTVAYDNGELQAALEHYYTSKFILGKMDIEFLRRCQAITGNVPGEVYRFSTVQ